MDRLAEASGAERWQAFMRLDEVLEQLADGASVGASPFSGAVITPLAKAVDVVPLVIAAVAIGLRG